MPPNPHVPDLSARETEELLTAAAAHGLLPAVEALAARKRFAQEGAVMFRGFIDRRALAPVDLARLMAMDGHRLPTAGELPPEAADLVRTWLQGLLSAETVRGRLRAPTRAGNKPTGGVPEAKTPPAPNDTKTLPEVSGTRPPPRPPAPPGGRDGGDETLPEDVEPRPRPSPSGPATHAFFLPPPPTPEEIEDSHDPEWKNYPLGWREEFEHYVVLSRLGRGGMGAVLCAWHTGLRKKVALKTIRPEFGANPMFQAAFLHEVGLAANLKHPNVMPMHGGGSGRRRDGREILYYEMPFYRSMSLRDVLKQRGALEPRLALDLAARLAEALHYAHSHLVYHLDVKPENVLLPLGEDGEPDLERPSFVGREPGWGRPLLLDFGIGKAAREKRADPVRPEGEDGGAEGPPSRPENPPPGDPDPGLLSRFTLPDGVAGLEGACTPIYAPAEQQEPGLDVLDGRADVFALGVTLWECLAGPLDPEDRHPFPYPRFASFAVHARRNALWPSGVWPGHAVFAMRAVGLAPAERYASAQTMAQAIRGYLEHDRLPQDPLLPRRMVLAHNGLAWMREHKKIALAAAAVVLVTTSAVAGPRVLDWWDRGNLVLPDEAPSGAVLSISRPDGSEARSVPLPMPEPLSLRSGAYVAEVRAPDRLGTKQNLAIARGKPESGPVVGPEVRVWETPAQEASLLRPVYLTPDRVPDLFCAENPQSLILVARSGDDGRLLWKLEIGGEIAGLLESELDDDGYPDLMAGAAYRVVGVSGRNGRKLWVYEGPAKLTGMVLLPGTSGRPDMVAGLTDGSVVRVNSSTGRMVWEATLLAPSAVFAKAVGPWGPAGANAIVANAAGQVFVLDASTGRVIRTIPLPAGGIRWELNSQPWPLVPSQGGSLVLAVFVAAAGEGIAVLDPSAGLVLATFPSAARDCLRLPLDLELDGTPDLAEILEGSSPRARINARSVRDLGLGMAALETSRPLPFAAVLVPSALAGPWPLAATYADGTLASLPWDLRPGWSCRLDRQVEPGRSGCADWLGLGASSLAVADIQSLSLLAPGGRRLLWKRATTGGPDAVALAPAAGNAWDVITVLGSDLARVSGRDGRVLWRQAKPTMNGFMWSCMMVTKDGMLVATGNRGVDLRNASTGEELAALPLGDGVPGMLVRPPFLAELQNGDQVAVLVTDEDWLLAADLARKQFLGGNPVPGRFPSAGAVLSSGVAGPVLLPALPEGIEASGPGLVLATGEGEVQVLSLTSIMATSLGPLKPLARWTGTAPFLAPPAVLASGPEQALIAAADMAGRVHLLALKRTGLYELDAWSAEAGWAVDLVAWQQRPGGPALLHVAFAGGRLGPGGPGGILACLKLTGEPGNPRPKLQPVWQARLPSNLPACGVTVADLDGDNDLDLAASCVDGRLVLLSGATGEVLAAEAGAFTVPPGARPLAADLDGDGRSEVVAPAHYGVAAWRAVFGNMPGRLVYPEGLQATVPGEAQVRLEGLVLSGAWAAAQAETTRLLALPAIPGPSIPKDMLLFWRAVALAAQGNPAGARKDLEAGGLTALQVDGPAGTKLGPVLLRLQSMLAAFENGQQRDAQAWARLLVPVEVELLALRTLNDAGLLNAPFASNGLGILAQLRGAGGSANASPGGPPPGNWNVAPPSAPILAEGVFRDWQRRVCTDLAPGGVWLGSETSAGQYGLRFHQNGGSFLAVDFLVPPETGPLSLDLADHRASLEHGQYAHVRIELGLVSNGRDAPTSWTTIWEGAVERTDHRPPRSFNLGTLAPGRWRLRWTLVDSWTSYVVEEFRVR